MRPRSVSPASEYSSVSPTGSRRILAGLLRGLGQVLEKWADRLEAAITQVTTTLPDPRVRKDLLATIWRVWLTIVVQLERRLPRGWGAVVAGFVPIAIMGTVVGLGIWFLVHLGSTPETRGRQDFTASPGIPPTDISQPALQPSEGLRSPEASDLEDSPRSSDAEVLPDDLSRENFADEESSVIRPEPEPLSPEPDSIPLGPPVPDWSSSRVASPFESMLQTQIIEGLPPSLQPLIERIQVNFRQQQLTIHLTAEGQTLTSEDQHQFVERVRRAAQKLDFPHLQIMDDQGNLLARTAIVGQGIIFLSPS